MSQASTTALLVAGYRARAHLSHPELCRDHWAPALAGEDGVAYSREFDAVQPHMELWLALRTAWFDAQVTAALDRGFAQAVILGAGLDSRAARLARPGVTWFEVDQPASLAERARRLAAAPGYPGGSAVRVECDFASQDFVDRLVASGFRADQPAVLVWEGVSYYLPEEAVRATLGAIARRLHPDSVVLFDLVGRKMAEGSVRHADDLATRSLVQRYGEPLRWGTNDALPLLAELGYRTVRVRSFDEVGLELTGTYDRARRWRFQFLALASAGRVPGGNPESFVGLGGAAR